MESRYSTALPEFLRQATDACLKNANERQRREFG